jgi:hypothetical protein
MLERRTAARQRSFMQGRIYFNHRRSSLDCTVRDFTSKGARLECSEAVAIPDVFELYVPNKDEYFRSRLAWRKGNLIGVAWAAEQTAPETAAVSDPIAERIAKLEREVARLTKRLDALQS